MYVGLSLVTLIPTAIEDEVRRHFPLAFPFVNEALALPFRWSAAPFYFLQQTLIVYVALRLFWLPSASTRTDGAQRVAPLAVDPELVNEAAHAVLKSDTFLTTLRDALPSTKHDVELAHVPYILSALERRRDLAAVQAQRFFNLTVVAGAIFSCVVIFYGYILVNETAVGFPHAIAQLSDRTQELVELRRRTTDGYRYSSEAAAVQDAAARLDSHLRWRSEMGRLVHDAALGVSRQTLDQLDLDLHGYVQERDGADADAEVKAEIAILSEAVTAMLQVERDKDRLEPKLFERLASTASKAEEVSTTDDHRLIELAKRVSVGLIVTSLLLAVLRYLAGLYRESRLQAADYVAQEIAVRRFCVAYLAAKTDQMRENIGAAFVGGVAAAPDAPAEEGLTKAAEQHEALLSQLRAIIDKRVGS